MINLINKQEKILESIVSKYPPHRAKSAEPTKIGNSDGQYFAAWSYSLYEQKNPAGIAAWQYQQLTQTGDAEPLDEEKFKFDPPPPEFRVLREETKKHLSDCARLFELSAHPKEADAMGKDSDKIIEAFKKKHPNIEKNFIGQYKPKDDLMFTYQRGLKEAINFFEHNGIFAEYKSYRIAIPHRPFFLSPFGIYSWMLNMSRHFNDTYWNGFLETAFYVGAKCPTILDYDGAGPIEPSYHRNLQVRFQLMVLKAMDRVRLNAGITEHDDYRDVDPKNRTAMICATYHQLIIDSARPNSNDQALLIRKGHNPITCMLRMIQKNHHLTSEILDPENDIPFRKELADALLHFRPSRVRIYFKGTEIDTTTHLRWYESYGKKYEYIFNAFKAYKDKAKSAIGAPGPSWLYAVPYAILCILLWFLPDPESWREEGRLNEFGLGRRGLERIAYSAKQLHKGDALPQHRAVIDTYLENFKESKKPTDSPNP